MSKLLFNWAVGAKAVLLAVAVACMFVVASRADDSPPRKHTMENRFLFLIDTSSAMKSRSEGVESTVLDLLNSGMKGEFRQGDTLGIWTYSDAVNTSFPRQIWTAENKDELVAMAARYLHSVKYEKRSHLERAWPAVAQAAANSERLTVILIHDGSDSMKGTPFDKDINDLQREYAHEFKVGHDPFVTVLVSRDHEFYDYSINFPISVTIPHTADPIIAVVTNIPVTVIVTNIPAPVIVTNAAPPPTPVVSVPTPAHETPAPEPPRRFTIPPEREPTNVVAQVAKPAPAPAPAPKPAAAVPQQPTNAPVVPPVAAIIPTPAPTNPPAKLAVSNSIPTPVVESPKTNAPAPVVHNLEIASTEKPVESNAVAAPSPEPPATRPPIAAQQEAIPASGNSSSSQVGLITAAGALLAVAVGLVIFLIRRSRGAPPASLISQSMDRPS